MIPEHHIKWVNDRKKKFTDEQKRVYHTISQSMRDIDEIEKSTLTREEKQFVWDTVCQEEHMNNEEKVREYARLHPREINALEEYIENQ